MDQRHSVEFGGAPKPTTRTNITPVMLKTLRLAAKGKVTGFGYTVNTGERLLYLNVNSVKALINRGLLEQSGEQLLWSGRQEEHTPLYQVSETGTKVLEEAT